MNKIRQISVFIITISLFVFITLIVCASLLQDTSIEAFSGSGTEASPYLITSYSDLTELSTNVSSGTTYSGKYFKLTTNITITDSNWLGVGDSSSTSHPFAGVFDGANYKITINSLSISSKYFGFFITTSSTSIIKNLNIHYNSLTNTSTSNSDIGGIVAYNEGAIENCKSSGSITSAGTHVGGIAGTNRGTIANCVNSATISSTAADYAAGIASYLVGTIKNCSNTGKVSIVYPSGNTGTVWVGGIAGMMTSSTIENCYNTANLKASTSYYGALCAGICGHMSNTNTIKNCYNTGYIESYVYTPKSGNTSYGAKASGICSLASDKANFYNCIDRGSQYAYADSTTAEWPSRSAIAAGLCALTYGGSYNSISIGTQTAEGNYDAKTCGGVYLPYGDLTGIYYTGPSSGYGTQKASLTTDIKSLSTYSSGTYSWSNTYPWDFTNIWGINEQIESGYPVLRTFYNSDDYILTYKFSSSDISQNINEALDIFGDVILKSNTTFLWAGHAYNRWTDGTSYYDCNSAQKFGQSKTLWPDWYATVYTVTVESGNINWGTVSGGGTNYPLDGTGQTTISAFPKTGYVFVEWQKGGVSVSKNSQETFLVTESVTYVAIFKIIQYEITVSTNNAAFGSVSFEGGLFDYGTLDKQSIAIPKSGYAFRYWLITKNGKTQTEKSNPLTIKIDGNKTIQAVFSSIKVEGVNISATYGGSATLVGDNFDSLGNNDTITLISKLEVKGYKFVNWVDMSGNVLGTSASIQLNKSQIFDNVISAVFIKMDNNLNDEVDNINDEIGV